MDCGTALALRAKDVATSIRVRTNANNVPLDAGEAPPGGASSARILSKSSKVDMAYEGRIKYANVGRIEARSFELVNGLGGTARGRQLS